MAAMAQPQQTTDVTGVSGFVQDLEGLVESTAPAPDDGLAWKTAYFQT